MSSWIYLILAISLELAGSTCLKLSDSFTKVLPSILLFVFYGLCYYFFAIALKTIDLSVAYAIWSGLGTTVVAIIGIFQFKELISIKQVLAIGMIVIGVVLLDLLA
ncbi:MULTISPECIES: multidrug efflux SMR transporter [Spirulina sp. CCY15215]|uniref:DMT family transporter n=1 Tax=Spirulina sp. CCY15215 TaxID=2767591 RepID=UPI0019512175|nr:multidrug efflux SMR transporter [Spirulina major]